MIYLASKSPRRRQLLQQLGLDFKTIRVDVPEKWDGIETVEEYVSRLALEKARRGKELTGADDRIIAADTEVVIDNEVLGKPVDRSAALEMLKKLSGRTHLVLSAVAVIDATEAVLVNKNRVSFKELSGSECESYCDTSEPYDKAGAYAIQGLAADFIIRLEGSYSGVMGLPLTETGQLLNR